MGGIVEDLAKQVQSVVAEVGELKSRLGLKSALGAGLGVGLFPALNLEDIVALIGPEYTLRDSTDTACGPVGGAANPAENICDIGEERTVLVKIKNMGSRVVAAADCPFTVELVNAAGAVQATQKLNPGQSTALRRRNVQTVRIVCDPAPIVASRCKANYTIVVNRN